MNQEHRGLRFVFCANAEIASESSPSFAPAHVTELSLHGCFVETSASFEIQQPVLLKIHHSEEHCEVEASVLYVKPSGVGLIFRQIQPQFREVLQTWVLRALDEQAGPDQISG